MSELTADMNRSTHATLRIAGVSVLCFALTWMVSFRLGCEIVASTCAVSAGKCPAESHECGKGEPTDDMPTCYICWTNCCAFVEASFGQLLAPVITVEAATLDSEIGPRLTYPPLLPPPRGVAV